MIEPLIQTQGLTKRYGGFTAVDQLDLELTEGEVYGFLGPNGSGKSTTILMLLGLTEPTEGTVRVLGRNPTRDPLGVKREVGYLPEAVGFYSDLTGRENLLYTAALNNISRSAAHQRVEELLEMVELSDAANQVVGQYSRGMRQRLGLADVLLKDPRIVILDDPTLGLDPTGIRWLLGLIEEMSASRNITILLASHQLHEVQRVCHRVGIMSHGQMVMQGSMDELTARQEGGGYQLTLELRGLAEPLAGTLRSLPGVTRCDVSGNEVVMESTQDIRGRVATAIVEHGAELLELSARNRSLEDIYLKYFQAED